MGNDETSKPSFQYRFSPHVPALECIGKVLDVVLRGQDWSDNGCWLTGSLSRFSWTTIGGQQGGPLGLGPGDLEKVGALKEAAFTLSMGKYTVVSIHYGFEERLLEVTAHGPDADEARSELEEACHHHLPSGDCSLLESGDSLAGTLDALRIELRAVRSASASLITERETQRAELAELKKTYEEHMKLKAPASYWEARASEYQKKANGRFWSLVCVIVMVVAGVSCLLWQLDRFIGTAPQYLQLSAFLVCVGFLAWILRLVVRSYFSVQHLAEDASARHLLVTTYLALFSEGNADREDRGLVLAQLFAPTNYGLLRDESSPFMAAELLKASRSAK